MMTHTVQSQLEAAIAAPAEGFSGDVYAILDGAMVKQLPDWFEEHDAPHACLFSGENDPMILTRAPWLVRAEPGSETMAWILQEGWARNWGMFAVVPRETPFDAVLGHFRKFLQVRLPDERLVFFRFYDPRVQRLFLPSCDHAQSFELFGLPLAWICEGENGDALLTHTLHGSAVKVKKTPLDSFRDSINI
jgi:hypothetical protein